MHQILKYVSHPIMNWKIKKNLPDKALNSLSELDVKWESEEQSEEERQVHRASAEQDRETHLFLWGPLTKVQLSSPVFSFVLSVPREFLALTTCKKPYVLNLIV